MPTWISPFIRSFIDDVRGICRAQRALSLFYLSAGKQKIASFFPLMRLHGAVCVSQTQKQGPCAYKMSRKETIVRLFKETER